MAQEQHRKDKPTSDGVAQQPGIKSESSGSSGLGGKHDPDAKNASSGAMDGQGTFGSGANGPGMGQSSGKDKEKADKKKPAKKGWSLQKNVGKKFPDGPGDPEGAQEGLI